MKRKHLVYALFMAIFYFQSINAQNIPQYDHIVIAIMENHAYSNIIGSSNAPYINSLVNDSSAANFTQSFGLTHPSQPNYLMLFSGSNQGVTTDATPSNFPFTTPNLGASLLAKSLTFTGYSEDLPFVGFNGSTSGNYARKHNPWVNWQDATTNGIPSINNKPFTSFPSDFSTLPTVSFIIPSIIHDMHNPIGSPSAIVNGDTWLHDNIDAYVQWAKTHNSLFILTFDEDDNSHSNRIPTVFVGKYVLKGQYSEKIDHYILLRTLEDMYGLPYAGNSASKNPITDCWVSITGIENSDKTESLTLFPNPAAESLTLAFYSNQQQNIKIIVTDMLSKTIINISKEVNVGKNNFQITTEKFTVGTYFVNVISSEKSIVKRLIVKK